MAETAIETIPLSKAERMAASLPIAGEPMGKHFLSMGQLNEADIFDYLAEAEAAETLFNGPQRGAPVLPYVVLKIIMQQASTRTGGSMETAMEKIGGSAGLYSGMGTSSEAKGESRADTWVAFATQADIIGTRTPEVFGPHFAAHSIEQSFRAGKLSRNVPVINLGDGTNEHPTQAMGDVFTILKHYFSGKADPFDSAPKSFEGMNLVVVGDHERYRAIHSLYIAAATLGINVTAIESPVAQVSNRYAKLLGDRLQRTDDLDGAMRDAHVLYMGRNPDEYTGEHSGEKHRSKRLARSYKGWVVDKKRLQQMPGSSMVLHPRPRRNELHRSVDTDPRAKDVAQMENMIPMRAAIIARHMGESILAHIS